MGIAVLFLGFLASVAAIEGKIAHEQKNSESEHQWTIYTREDFQHNELCQVLNCKKYEVCMVRNNNAMCVNKNKLDHVEGDKSYFRGDHHSKVWKQHRYEKNSLKNRGWEFNEHDTKFLKHLQKLKSQKLKHKKEWEHKEYEKKKSKKRHKNVTPRHPKMEGFTTTQAPIPDCSEEELYSMGGRLLQWFSDVHSIEKTAVATLPHHHVSCREDVAWMFEQWDGDNDGELTVEELNSLEQDQYEHCITPFIDRCDTDADDTISIDEWCDCFQWADKVREEPPCHKAKHKSNPHMLGTFIPRCDAEGYYRPEQCHERQCWCTDRWGREFDQSRNKGRADCRQYAEKDSDDEDLLNEEASGGRATEL